MLGKVVGFIVCILLGAGIFMLSLIGDTLTCDNNYCISQSKISYLNLVINEDKFAKSEITEVSCNAKSQPSRRGKQTYYVLSLDKSNGAEYFLGSFKKYSLCKKQLIPIKDYLKGKRDNLTYTSSTGFTNSMGFVFGILLFFVGYIILTSKPAPVVDEYDDDDKPDE